MSWVRLDDGFLRHPKVLQAGRDARDLYLASVLYCASNLTDGLVPGAALVMLAAEAGVDLSSADAFAERLIAVGLWERGDGGYHVHDYLDYNPTSEDVKRQREENAKRQAAWRTRRTEERNGVSNAVTNAVSNAPVTPAPLTSSSPVRPKESYEERTPLVVPPPVAAKETVAAVAANPRGSPIPKHQAGPPLNPLFDAFTALKLGRPLVDARGEATAAQNLLRVGTPEQIAACWQDAETGSEFWDGFSRRDLSFDYLLTRNRFTNWVRWKKNGVTNAKPTGRTSKPEHPGRVALHSDPRAFADQDRG